MAILESDAKKKKEASHNHYDGSVSMSDRAVQFCQRYDDYCALQIESVLTTFQNHSQSRALRNAMLSAINCGKQSSSIDVEDSY